AAWAGGQPGMHALERQRRASGQSPSARQGTHWPLTGLHFGVGARHSTPHGPRSRGAARSAAARSAPGDALWSSLPPSPAAAGARQPPAPANRATAIAITVRFATAIGILASADWSHRSE